MLNDGGASRPASVAFTVTLTGALVTFPLVTVSCKEPGPRFEGNCAFTWPGEI